MRARTKPGHAWTNSFVERLERTILPEHGRLLFPRKFFTQTGQLQASVDGFLRLCNKERPHQGDRTPGPTPAKVFWGMAAHPSANEV